MRLRRAIALFAVSILILAGVAAPASAGGWATIELSKPVSSATVGEAVTFEFMVLQHGINGLDGDKPTLTAIHADSGEKIEIAAIEKAKAHYTAVITFDQPGRWKLRASSGIYPSSSSFPTLYVSEKGAVATPTSIAKPVKAVEVQLVNYSFVPSLIEISVGDAVAFTNIDSAKHEIAFYEDSIDDSGLIGQGEGMTVVFTEAGEYHVACGPHAGMSATIRVK